MQDKVKEIHDELHTRNDDINDFKGWVDLPNTYDKLEFKRIEQVAKKVQAHSDVLLVIGVGGSYLGSKAAIDMLRSEEHTSELQSRGHLVCRLLLEKKKKTKAQNI